MKWVGLTGGIASGKTTAANIFRELRVPVIDADRLAHQALLRLKDRIATYFGAGILGEDGEVDRTKLGQLVFGDESKLRKLERLVHPFVNEQAQKKRRLFESSGQKLAIYDVPLLFENNLKSQFDEVILVYIPEDVALQRLIDRNGFSEEEAKKRIKIQMDIEKKKSMADVIFDNQGDIDHLKKQVTDYFNSIKG